MGNFNFRAGSGPNRPSTFIKYFAIPDFFLLKANRNSIGDRQKNDVDRAKRSCYVCSVATKLIPLFVPPSSI